MGANRAMETLSVQVDEAIQQQTHRHLLSVLDGSLGEKLTKSCVSDLTGDTVEYRG